MRRQGKKHAAAEKSPRAQRTEQTRERLMDLVTRRPGISLTAITQGMGAAWSGLHYHIRALERAGKLRHVTHGRRRLLYPVDTRQPDPIADGLLHGSTARRIAQAIAEHEELDIAELEAMLDLTPRVAYYHVRRFVEAELVTAGSATRYRRLRATPRLLNALAPVAPNPRQPETPPPGPPIASSATKKHQNRDG